MMQVYVFYCFLISNILSLVKQHFGCLHELANIIWVTATCTHSTQRNKLSQNIPNSTPIRATQMMGPCTRASLACPGEHACLTVLWSTAPRALLQMAECQELGKVGGGKAKGHWMISTIRLKLSRLGPFKSYELQSGVRAQIPGGESLLSQNFLIVFSVTVFC